jgi:polyisoprenyl-phosphate glycosyltransferase
MMYSVIIPAYNEEKNLSLLYEKLKEILSTLEEEKEFIFVNDGSSDGTLNILEDIAKRDGSVKILSFSRNFGKQSAIFCGYEHAAGDAIIVIDADLQHPPELIPQMIEKWKEGYEIVYTIRQRTEKIGFFRRLGSGCFYRFYQFLSDTKIPANTPDFRLLDKKVVQVMRRFREKKKFGSGLIGWVGFKQTSISFSATPRFTGTTKYSWLRLFGLAVDAMTSFSIVPLTVSFYFGFIVSFFAFFYALYALIVKLFAKWPVSGWASVILSVLFLGGVQLMVLGIIGKYIGLMYEEIRDRPYYIISKKIGYTDESPPPESPAPTL